MIARYVRWIDSDDFVTFFFMADLYLCCMNRPLEYCGFMSLSSTWLEQLDFEVSFRQDHSDPRARVLLGWQNVEVFAARSFYRSQIEVGVGDFEWVFYYRHWFLLILTQPVYSSCSRLAFSLRYSTSLCVVALTEFSACSFLRVLYKTHCDVSSIFNKPAGLCVGRPALLPLLSAHLDVVQ